MQDTLPAPQSPEHDADPLRIDLLDNSRTGVVYLSRIPTRMTVKIVREYLAEFGPLGRIFLKPNSDVDWAANKKYKKSDTNKTVGKRTTFKEGWVEFVDKEDAKLAAITLNNNPVVAKKRNPWYGELWNIKYLPRFKWTHLNERQDYERLSRKQRLRTEVAQAKREADFFTKNLEISKRLKRKKVHDRNWVYEQRQANDIVAVNESCKNVVGDSNFIKQLFTGGISGS